MKQLSFAAYAGLAGECDRRLLEKLTGSRVTFYAAGDNLAAAAAKEIEEISALMSEHRIAYALLETARERLSAPEAP